MSAPQPGTPFANLQAIAQKIADATSWKKGTDNYARIYQGALRGAMLCDEVNYPKAQALADTLRDVLGAMEYWAGCDEGCTADTASSEIMSSGGAWPSTTYDKAKTDLAAWDAKP